MLKVIKGDLLKAKEKYIVHQTNCCSSGAAGLAYHIFRKFSYSDVYSNRMQNDMPGDIIIRGNGEDERFIIALMGQYYPGNASVSKKDTSKARMKYFHQGLVKVAGIPDLESVAFPWQIGCGLAGGDWRIYSKMLENFADYLGSRADVVVYKLL